MKRKLNYTAALATTAAVALLAGAAHAQMGGSPQVCTTTQNSPAHNNCVMPTAAAPGGGSFPGSFLVPGTNTSLAIHGFIQIDLTRDFGPHMGDTTFGATGIPINGVGVATNAASSLNGGTTFTAKATRPNIETRTPTAYGELKTYIEFDFNQTGGTQLGGNNDLLRLRHAYGTLGPWLIGQTFSAYADPQSWADTAAGAQDVGMFNTFNVRRPQVRYTWLAGNGLSVAGSLEEPTYPSAAYSVGSNANGTALTGVALNGVTTYYNWPHFVVAPEWDQPWGHLRLAVAGGVSDVRTEPTGANLGNKQWGSYAIHLSGHLNTWGKDALRGGLWYNHGAGDFNSWVTQGGIVYNNTTGASEIQKAWSVYANYEHFFTGQWRANASGGYMKVSGNPFTTSCTGGVNCAAGGLVKEKYTTELNVIYSPVPQTDFYLEWQRAYDKVMSGANGTADRIDAQFKFYF